MFWQSPSVVAPWQDTFRFGRVENSSSLRMSRKRLSVVCCVAYTEEMIRSAPEVLYLVSAMSMLTESWVPRIHVQIVYTRRQGDSLQVHGLIRRRKRFVTSGRETTGRNCG